MTVKKQAWFWSKKWQKGEKAVEKELAAKGPGKPYTSEEMTKELEINSKYKYKAKSRLRN